MPQIKTRKLFATAASFRIQTVQKATKLCQVTWHYMQSDPKPIRIYVIAEWNVDLTALCIRH